MNTDLFIKSVAGTTAQTDYMPTSGREFYCISLLYEGVVSLISRDSTTAIDRPALLLVENGELPVYSIAAGSRIVSLCFSNDFLENENLPWHNYLNRVFFHHVIPLTTDELNGLHGYFSLMAYEHDRNDATSPAIMANLLMIILKMIVNLSIASDRKAQASGHRLAYFKYKVLIEQYFKRQHYVQAYADQLCMTAEMLGKIVKDTVNKTPKQLIDQRLITEARRMLVWTRISSKEIAYDLGFESDSYFNRYFKKHCHQTPASYRQQFWQEKASESAQTDLELVGDG